MQIIPVLIKEMEAEATTTRKMLALVPAEKFGWKPHEKSMTLQQLATHLAEIPGWVSMTLNTSELDFNSGDYKPTVLPDTAALLATFEKSFAEGKERLARATEEELELPWTMRNGDIIYFTQSKLEVIRHSFCQIVHHRAQLGVFLRLLNIPIPGSYGPSADDASM